MRKLLIPKGNGEHRLIYAPSIEEKAKLRSVLGVIAKKARQKSPENVVHGFTVRKSPVTNAMAHIGHQWTLVMDLKDFFDSVNEVHLKGKLTKDELDLVLVDGAPRQGLPTSPAVANLAACDMDHAILKFIHKGKGAIYTRYADDLTFSADDRGIIDALRKEVPAIVSRCGFRLNKRKTRILCASQGRRIVTGVAVGEDAVHIPRKVKRRLRAALHRGNVAQARGLEEWSKLRLPRENGGLTYLQSIEELESVCRSWNLAEDLMKKWTPDKGEDEWLRKDVLVTGDPVYILGMSTLTTGWRSCMRQPDGQYRKGAMYWALLRGAYLAALLSDRTMTVGSATRRVMRSRVMVFVLRTDPPQRFFDDKNVYGDEDSGKELAKTLKAHGIRPMSGAPSHVRVVGHVSNKITRPYVGSAGRLVFCKPTTATGGPHKGKKVSVVMVK